MNTQNDPNSSSGKPLGSSGGPPDPLDAALGALTPPERRRWDEHEGAAAAAERVGWERLLELERRAFAPELDDRAGSRIAARVVDRVQWEEERDARAESSPSRAQRWRVIWVRLLAASVAVHVAVLGVWSVLARRHADPVPVEAFSPIATLRAPSDVAPFPASDDPGSLAPPAPYVLEPGDLPPGAEASADGLPVERLFRLELAAETRIPAPAAGAYAAFPRGAARAMWVRGSDPMKRLIEARVGSEGSLDAVQRSLAALARFQRADGSYDPAAGRTAPESTALVLLSFLGDGSCSRGGAHRTVVERGIAWLRAWRRDAPAAGVGPYEVAALAEDFMLVNGTMTPAGSRARSTELASLVERAPRAGAGAADPAVASAWAMASAALERAGLGAVHPFGEGDARAVAIEAVVDARTAVWTGTETLRRGDAAAFRRWASTSSLALRARLAPDGLVSGPGAATDADRVEETALVLLALEVPYRTY